MANRGKNKCKRGSHSAITEEQTWFKAKKKRNRKRNKVQKESRKKNR